MINGKVIFITGGTGSFGNAFVNELLLKYKPKIIIYSRDELKQYEWKINSEKYQKIMRFFIGIYDLSRLKLVNKM